MKKVIQISFVALVVIAIAVSMLALTGTGSAMAGKVICPSVGWNSRGYGCLSAAPQVLLSLGLKLPPEFLPQVGWNG
jgi:hypothetical protein